MKSEIDLEPAPTWDAQTGAALIEELWSLRKSMLENQARLEPRLRDIDPEFRLSATNLAHYLAMRIMDLRHLQDRLAWMGVSSLGRAETHVLANVDKVLGILHRLTGLPWEPLSRDEPAGFNRGSALLAKHAETLFGAAPPDRGVRIMVTLLTMTPWLKGLFQPVWTLHVSIAPMTVPPNGWQWQPACAKQHVKPGVRCACCLIWAAPSCAQATFPTRLQSSN